VSFKNVVRLKNENSDVFSIANGSVVEHETCEYGAYPEMVRKTKKIKMKKYSSNSERFSSL